MDTPALTALTAPQAASAAPQDGKERAAVEKRPAQKEAPAKAAEAPPPAKGSNYLSIQMDDESGKTVVKVMDSTTNEVLRQFPAQELVNLARHLGKMQGLLLDGKA